jgi:hypothetical protein
VFVVSFFVSVATVRDFEAEDEGRRYQLTDSAVQHMYRTMVTLHSMVRRVVVCGRSHLLVEFFFARFNDASLAHDGREFTSP